MTALYSVKLLGITTSQIPLQVVEGRTRDKSLRPAFLKYFGEPDCYSAFQQPIPRRQSRKPIRFTGRPFVPQLGQLIADRNKTQFSFVPPDATRRRDYLDIREPKLLEARTADLRRSHLPITLRTVPRFRCPGSFTGASADCSLYLHIYPYGAVVVTTWTSVTSRSPITPEALEKLLREYMSAESQLKFLVRGRLLSVHSLVSDAKALAAKAIATSNFDELFPAALRQKFTFCTFPVRVSKRHHEVADSFLEPQPERSPKTIFLRKRGETISLQRHHAVAAILNPDRNRKLVAQRRGTQIVRKFGALVEFCLCRMGLYKSLRQYMESQMLELSALSRMPSKKLGEDILTNKRALVQRIEELERSLDSVLDHVDSRFQLWYHLVSGATGLAETRKSVHEKLGEWGKLAKSWEHPIKWIWKTVFSPLTTVLKPLVKKGT